MTVAQIFYSMQVINRETRLDKNTGTVITIGKFDGVHRGHRKIFEQVMDEKGSTLKSLAVSFRNPPSLLTGKNSCGLLLTEKEKIRKLETFGFDYYCELAFDEELMNTEAEVFFRDYVVSRWNARRIVVGDDFCFGKERRGNTEVLGRLCRREGIELAVVNRLCYEGEPVSSSRIKACLTDGQTETANNMLGYPYFFEGEVASGNRLGRTMGIPTINIYPENGKCIPLFGVYGSYVEIEGRIYKGITNVGVRPTVAEDNRIVIETNLIDFDGDLYGKKLEVRLEKFIRKEIKFDSLEKLKEQINSDKKYWTNCK